MHQFIGEKTYDLFKVRNIIYYYVYITNMNQTIYTFIASNNQWNSSKLITYKINILYMQPQWVFSLWYLLVSIQVRNNYYRMECNNIRLMIYISVFMCFYVCSFSYFIILTFICFLYLTYYTFLEICLCLDFFDILDIFSIVSLYTFSFDC